MNLLTELEKNKRYDFDVKEIFVVEWSKILESVSSARERLLRKITNCNHGSIGVGRCRDCKIKKIIQEELGDGK